MPWVRIDENAMDHPKFLALTDGAWRLWCEGQTYCQKHLTDGAILFPALRGFRYYSPARVKNLIAPHVPGKGPLWHQDERGNVQVHDYLDWNDSREEVLHAREAAKMRRRRYDERNASGNASADAERTPNVSSGVYVRGDLRKKINGTSYARGTNPDDFKADTLSRVAPFIERYKALYVKHRKGAHYLSHPQKDFPEAALLCETYDDERLDKLAAVFLQTDHEFAEKGSRTLAQFRSMASWCDHRLKERGL